MAATLSINLARFQDLCCLFRSGGQLASSTHQRKRFAIPLEGVEGLKGGVLQRAQCLCDMYGMVPIRIWVITRGTTRGHYVEFLTVTKKLTQRPSLN